MQKRHIIVFSTSYLPDIGGAEIAVSQISDGLRGDFAFSMITPRYKKERASFEKIGAVTVYRVGFGLSIDKFLLPILGIARAYALIQKSENTILWAVMASQAGLLAALVRLLKPHTKLCLTLQEGDEEEHLYRYVFGSRFLYKICIRPWYLFIQRRADVVTVISSWLKERAERNGVTAKIHYIPNGVEIAEFEKKYSSEELLPIYQKHKLRSTGVTYLITTSRLTEKNGVGTSIKALQYMPHNYHLLILGSGKLQAKLQTITNNLSLNERVHFLGSIPHNEIPKYLQISSIFVRPSLSEGMGNSFIEAMVAGIPVIATPVGGIVDFLTDKETGLFCRVEQPKTIANAVQNLERSPELREKIIKNAKREVLAKYDWKVIIPKMKAVFLEL